MGVLDQFRLDRKVALVTGSGQGIGRIYALALAEAGADVAIADINDRTGPLVAEEVRARGRRSIFVHADVTNVDDVNALVARTVAELGDLDIAVNNAWVGGRSSWFRASRGFRGGGNSAEDFPLEEWDFVHNLLLRACLICCKAEVRPMIDKGRGKIVNMSSMSAFISSNDVAYGSAKAGVVSLTKRLAAEWGAFNVNVNCISPSFTLSPARRKDPQENRDYIRSLTPMGWHERPSDLAGTLIYLVSDASNYVTGQSILVDGGYTLNVWLSPPERKRAPLVSPEEETESLLHDLDVLGIAHDEHGVATD